jgi:hypothetical protein
MGLDIREVISDPKWLCSKEGFEQRYGKMW